MVARGARETRPREKRQHSSGRLAARTSRRLYRIAHSYGAQRSSGVISDPRHVPTIRRRSPAAFHGSIAINLCGSQVRMSKDQGASAPIARVLDRRGSSSSNARGVNRSSSYSDLSCEDQILDVSLLRGGACAAAGQGSAPKAVTANAAGRLNFLFIVGSAEHEHRGRLGESPTSAGRKSDQRAPNAVVAWLLRLIAVLSLSAPPRPCRPKRAAGAAARRPPLSFRSCISAAWAIR
jgi:hypothetical protein